MVVPALHELCRSGGAAKAFRWQIIAVLGGVKLGGHTPLLQVVQANYPLGLGSRPAQSGQQERRQDRDDRDHDEQFNQGKCARFLQGRLPWLNTYRVHKVLTT